MNYFAVVTKDPNAERTYTFDWSNFGDNDGTVYDPGYLQGDTLAASSWVLDTGISEVVADFGDTTASVKLSGGKHGKLYRAVNRVTTAAGEIDDRTLLVKVQHK